MQIKTGVEKVLNAGEINSAMSKAYSKCLFSPRQEKKLATKTNMMESQ